MYTRLVPGKFPAREIPGKYTFSREAISREIGPGIPVFREIYLTHQKTLKTLILLTFSCEHYFLMAKQ